MAYSSTWFDIPRTCFHRKRTAKSRNHSLLGVKSLCRASDTDGFPPKNGLHPAAQAVLTPKGKLIHLRRTIEQDNSAPVPDLQLT